MIRSVLALVLSMSVTAPAFAQSEGDKTLAAIGKIKDTITAYDQGTGTALAYYGGKITKWSFIALGAVAAGEAFTVQGTYFPHILQRATRPLRYPVFANNAKLVGVPAAAVGIGLVGASAIVFAAQHLWYGLIGQPHQTAELNAEQQELAAFFQQPTEAIYAQASANPELANKLIELADSIQLVEGVGYTK